MTNLSVIPGDREPDQRSESEELVRSQAEELIRLFRLAEQKIKLVEKLNKELSIPAINELRYAGYHMAEYLTGADGADEHLEKAQNHCKRAIFDASEAGVTHQLEVFQEFKYDFRHLIISEIVPGFVEIEAQVREATRLILAPKDASDSRAEYYEQCSVHLEKLHEANEKLDARREDLLKALGRINRQTRTYYLTLAGAVMTFVGVVFGALSYLKSQEQPTLASTALPAMEVPSVSNLGAEAPELPISR